MSDPNQPAYPPPAYPLPAYPGQAAPPQFPSYPPPGWVPPPYAHWGRRVCALLLDGVLFLPLYLIAVIGLVIVANTTTTDPVTDNLNFGSAAPAGFALIAIGYLAAFAFQIWNSIFRQGRTGASLGKKWMGIKVLSEETGQPIGALMTFVRQLVHTVDSLPCYVGYLWPLWDDKRQTFADKILKTMVLYLPTEGGTPPPS